MSEQPRDRGSAHTGGDQEGQNDWVGLLSADGRWRWDGQQWQPVEPPAPPETAQPPASQQEESARSTPWDRTEEHASEPVMPGQASASPASPEAAQPPASQQEEPAWPVPWDRAEEHAPEPVKPPETPEAPASPEPGQPPASQQEEPAWPTPWGRIEEHGLGPVQPADTFESPPPREPGQTPASGAEELFPPTPPLPVEGAGSGEDEPAWPTPWGGIDEHRPEPPVKPTGTAPPITRAALFGTRPSGDESPKKDRKPGSREEGTPQPGPLPPPILGTPLVSGVPPATAPAPPPYPPQLAPRPPDQGPPTRADQPVPPVPPAPPNPANQWLAPHPGSAPHEGSEPAPWPPTPSGSEGPPASPSSITTVRRQSPPPGGGLRRVLFNFSRGRVNPGPSPADIQRRQLLALARTHVNSCRRIAVISRKGGIGKTTTTLMLGHQFASIRGDRVVALDANPDAGSLADRVARQTGATVTDILREGDRLMAYSDIRSLTSQAPSRLEVVASDNDPHITHALGEQEYRQVMDVLARHYSLVLCDTGTGVLDSGTRGILNMADQIVLCAAPSLDASRVSALTLDWLEQQGYERLARDAVVAINAVRPNGLVELDLLQQYFQRRCRAVVRVPWDPRLSAGAETTLEELQPATRTAYLNLAAMVAAGFAR